MIRNTIRALLVALALPAAAQSVVPAANYSDIWWNPDESGWGVTFTQQARILANRWTSSSLVAVCTFFADAADKGIYFRLTSS